MKVPPKRKGNLNASSGLLTFFVCLNESPSEKEGKFPPIWYKMSHLFGLNESPSEKEGKSASDTVGISENACLNESPSEKEGKSA